MSSDGSVTHDKQTDAEKFNDFIVNVASNVAKKIPEQKQNHLDFLKNMISNTIYLSPVTPSEVISIMGSCKDSSPGFDDIKISPLRCFFSAYSQSLIIHMQFIFDPQCLPGNTEDCKCHTPIQKG